MAESASMVARERAAVAGDRVFGLAAEKGRWVYVVLGLVINLCLGTVYAWSVFKKPVEGLFAASSTEGSLPFMLFLAVFAVVMPIAGRWIQRFGARKICMIGGAITGAGWILSSFATSLGWLYVTYGVIAGIGVGLAYGGPIAVSTRWFPDKKGLAVGMTVGGFGLSALITAPLARYLIESMGALSTFLVLGIAFLVLSVLLSIPLKFPDAEWRPGGWKPSQAATATAHLKTGQMVRKSSFSALWLCFLIGSTAGLMAIGISGPVGQEIIKLDAATAAILVSVFAVFNGGGRPAFGWLTDRITPRWAALISFILIGLASVGMLMAGPGGTVLYILSFAGFWLSLGGWLAIAPTSTTTFFGTKDYASNYGVVFTAYGAGAIIGSLISGSAKDVFGSYTFAFIPTGILAVIGIVLAAVLLRPPKA